MNSRLQQQVDNLMKDALNEGITLESERISEMLEDLVIYLVDKGFVPSRREIEMEMSEVMYYFLFDRQTDLKHGHKV